MHKDTRRALALHMAVLAALFALQFALPDYHHRSFARILVLASYASGYNLLLGYTGLLSLGHAMLFAAGLYGAGLSVQLMGLDAASGFGIGLLSGLALALAVGAVALRTSGVAFMIVTLMLSQAAFLATFYFSAFTRGDEGFTLPEASQRYAIGDFWLDLTDPSTRYNMALLLFAACLMASFFLVRSPIGRVLIAIRENEPRTTMLGYHTFRYKLLALVVSGAISGAAGATYALLFSYVGSSFASIQYSILPLLWVLLGGVGTILGPLIGTALMFYLVDTISGYTSAHLLVVGFALVLLVLLFPKGIWGTLRAKAAPWLP